MDIYGFLAGMFVLSLLSAIGAGLNAARETDHRLEAERIEKAEKAERDRAREAQEETEREVLRVEMEEFGKTFLSKQNF